MLMVVAFSLSISLMISPGAMVQQAFFSMFDHDAQTLYESIHGNSVNRYPTLISWLSLAFHPYFLIVALFVSIIVTSMSTFRKFFTALWFATATGLSGLDIVNGMWTSDETMPSLIQNLVANSIGGLALASVSSIIAFVSDMLFGHSNIGRLSKAIISAIGIMSIGLLSSIFLYMSIVLVLHPLRIEARVVTTLPVFGTLGTEKPNASLKVSGNPFALIPTDTQLRRLELLGFDDLEFHWHRTQDDTKFALSLYAVSECNRDSEMEGLISDKAIFSKSGVRDVSILGNSTQRELQIVGEQSGVLISDTKDRSIRTFFLKEGFTESSMRITQLLDKHVKVQAKTSGSITVMMTGPLLESGEGRKNLVQSQFTLIVDGEEKRVTFLPVATIPDDSSPECKILWDQFANSDTFQFDDQIMAGILIQLKRIDTPTGYINESDGQYDLIRPGGWFTAPSVESKQLRGWGKMLHIDLPGSISEFEIEDIPQEFSHSQRFHGWGDLTASYLGDGGLMVSGKFRAAWLGTKRLNPTRWESWPPGFKIALLTALLGAPVGLFRMLMRLWQEDHTLSWWSNCQ